MLTLFPGMLHGRQELWRKVVSTKRYVAPEPDADGVKVWAESDGNEDWDDDDADDYEFGSSVIMCPDSYRHQQVQASRP